MGLRRSSGRSFLRYFLLSEPQQVRGTALYTLGPRPQWREALYVESASGLHRSTSGMLIYSN
jgi:hypothetical protein